MGDDTRRSVTVRRTAAGQLVAINRRGGELPLGVTDTDFTPVELLLVAIGACSALDVDALTSRRAEPESFEVHIAGDKVRDEAGNRMENLQVTFQVTFGDGDAGDAARAVLPDMIVRSHDRLCTVTRTVERATPVESRLA
jgi:putative redox protein